MDRTTDLSVVRAIAWRNRQAADRPLRSSVPVPGAGVTSGHQVPAPRIRSNSAWQRRGSQTQTCRYVDEEVHVALGPVPERHCRIPGVAQPRSGGGHQGTRLCWRGRVSIAVRGRHRRGQVAVEPPRWSEGASEWAHEREALAFVRSRLPDHEPWRAWSNVEFLADRRHNDRGSKA